MVGISSATQFSLQIARSLGTNSELSQRGTSKNWSTRYAPGAVREQSTPSTDPVRFNARIDCRTHPISWLRLPTEEIRIDGCIRFVSSCDATSYRLAITR